MGCLKGERTCIGCRRKASKGSLLRICRMPDGAVSLDLSGKGPGRGAYVCSARCLDAAVANGSLARALRTRIAADACERLRAQAQICAEGAFAKGSEE